MAKQSKAANTAVDYDNSDLRKRNVLVKLNTQTLGNVLKDKRASAEMCVREKADERVASVVKNVIRPTHPKYREIQKARGELRNYHVAETGPWDDDNFRIITARGYTAYKEHMDELIAKFDAAVQDFINSWDDVLADAKQCLGTLYNPSDYPTAKELKESFRAELITDVIPNRKDLRLDMDEERVQKIQQDAAERERDKIKQVGDHVMKVVAEELQHMSEALDRTGQKGDDDQRAKSFRNSLVPRMKRIANLLPALNITDDPKMRKLAQDITAKLCIHSSEDLRENETLRSEVKENADEMAKTLSHYFSNDKQPADAK